MLKLKQIILSAFVTCGVMSSLATITWNGETFPTTTAEATSLGYVTLTSGDPTNPRNSSYTNSVRWSDAKIPHADAKYFDGVGYLIADFVGMSFGSFALFSTMLKRSKICL